jgi:hypothetical protein
LAGYQESHKLNTDSLNELNEEWNRTDTNFNDVMERLRKDIAVLGDALTYLNNQN